MAIRNLIDYSERILTTGNSVPVVVDVSDDYDFTYDDNKLLLDVQIFKQGEGVPIFNLIAPINKPNKISEFYIEDQLREYIRRFKLDFPAVNGLHESISAGPDAVYTFVVKVTPRYEGVSHTTPLHIFINVTEGLVENGYNLDSVNTNNAQGGMWLTDIANKDYRHLVGYRDSGAYKFIVDSNNQYIYVRLYNSSSFDSYLDVRFPTASTSGYFFGGPIFMDNNSFWSSCEQVDTVGGSPTLSDYISQGLLGVQPYSMDLFVGSIPVVDGNYPNKISFKFHNRRTYCDKKFSGIFKDSMGSYIPYTFKRTTALSKKVESFHWNSYPNRMDISGGVATFNSESRQVNSAERLIERTVEVNTGRVSEEEYSLLLGFVSSNEIYQSDLSSFDERDTDAKVVNFKLKSKSCRMDSTEISTTPYRYEANFEIQVSEFIG